MPAEVRLTIGLFGAGPRSRGCCPDSAASSEGEYDDPGQVDRGGEEASNCRPSPDTISRMGGPDRTPGMGKDKTADNIGIGGNCYASDFALSRCMRDNAQQYRFAGYSFR